VIILSLAMLLLPGQLPAEPTPTPAAGKRRHARAPKILALPPRIVLPTYTPGPMPFREGEQLTYVASWLGIPAAQAQIELHHARHNPAVWVGEATVSTNKAVDLVYKMRDYLQERFADGTFEPRAMNIRQRENSRHDDYKVTFDHAEKLVTIQKAGPRGIQLKRFSASNPWGMMSGAALALSMPLKVGDKFVLDLFSATNRYVLSFTVTKRERLQTALGAVDALRIEPAVVYMSDAKMRSQARATTIWISADTRKLPLRIDSATFIGTVRIDLTKVENPHAAAAAGEGDGSAQ
jgi:Protein of unknown function (DUF3108)